ncbi:MAG: fatty acid desaturase [Bacteroidetes bacterium]|nr:fatty acid desaturase [Bacteroidota bacterium]
MGIAIAVTIISFWIIHLFYILGISEVSFSSPMIYLHILLQMYLSTGIFITSHDAMHRNICRNKFINNSIGYVTSFLFAGFNFKKLLKSHFIHHRAPTSGEDPDFNVHSQNFFLWWMKFLLNYVSVSQIIIMALQFNILILFFSKINVIIFWILPSFLSTLQLFYFGTYLPHRNPDHGLDSPHFARSQRKNHLWAMISCYFFGYHYEHHASPKTPWWKLYRISGN